MIRLVTQTEGFVRSLITSLQFFGHPRPRYHCILHTKGASKSEVTFRGKGQRGSRSQGEHYMITNTSFASVHYTATMLHDYLDKAIATWQHWHMTGTHMLDNHINGRLVFTGYIITLLEDWSSTAWWPTRGWRIYRDSLVKGGNLKEGWRGADAPDWAGRFPPFPKMLKNTRYPTSIKTRNDVLRRQEIDFDRGKHAITQTSMSAEFTSNRTVARYKSIQLNTTKLNATQNNMS